MHYASIIGIDVASEKLDISVRPLDGRSTATTIPYTNAALSDFLAKRPELDPTSSLVGLESTGDYHRTAARFFLERGFTVKLLNPILTKQYTRTTIRGTKTDKTDAELITKLLADGLGDSLSLANLQDGSKELLRIASGLTKLSSQLQLQLQGVKRKELPDSEHLIQRMTDLIGELKELSGDVVAQATKEPSEEERYIDSITGFATKLSAIVHHEIGDVSRFPNSKSLVAYAGLDPKIIQSGKQLDARGRLTKRGSSHLRYALCLAANVARIYDPELKAYFEKKKVEGRAFTEIICMIARKLLARIYTVLKERRCYIKRSS